MNFDQFSFDQRIVAGINSCGYETPTPIQQQAIPEVLKGRDVLGLAQTGTGKTAAFALPILQRLLEADAPKKGPVRTLVLAPTRELAIQIYENFVTLGKQTGIRCAAVYGGVGINPQIKTASKATIVVACPGRLLDLVDRGAISLAQLDTFVLDEADRMLDMGFMPDIRRILALLPAKRQNLLFSATMPSDIRHLADNILEKPATVQIASTSPVESVQHDFYEVRTDLKMRFLECLLDKTKYESVLIFTRTKYRAKSLSNKLTRLGHNSTFLQGNMGQGARQKALDGFRDGEYKVMVATDIAARGIDCDRITHVINFDAPDTAETYTHRIGRTGRAGRTGVAMSIVSIEDYGIIRSIEHVMKKKAKFRTLEGFDYDQAYNFMNEMNRNHEPRGHGRRSSSNEGRNRNSNRRGGKNPAKRANSTGANPEKQQGGNKPAQKAKKRPSTPETPGNTKRPKQNRQPKNDDSQQDSKRSRSGNSGKPRRQVRRPAKPKTNE